MGGMDVGIQLLQAGDMVEDRRKLLAIMFHLLRGQLKPGERRNMLDFFF